uniref:Palmitoyl-protein hydrolase n=1 Tax=Angiostrongylus cantonensis TaxID=6313 RepID=A0A158P7C9_ANGCA
MASTPLTITEFQPVILNVYERLRICAMEVICEQTEKWLRRTGSPRTRSPKLIIFAQPNSSDIGCCMLMDPNFVDIADFLKCDLLVFDYAGYGVSEGNSTEKTVYDSVERVYKYAVTDLKYQPKDIVLIGFSLGTAAMLGAMVLIAPFTSLWRVILRRPHVSASSCMDMFQSYEKAQNIRCPTLVCHGDQDAIVHHQHGLVMKERIANCELFQGIFCERKMWDDVNRFLREKVNIMEAWVRAVQESPSDVSGVIYG